MRKIYIDLSSDNHLQQSKVFGGYAGEHNETILQVKLPKRMVNIECSGYRFDFQTSEDNKISSPLISVSELENDTLSFHLVEQLTIAGKLLFNVVAILSDENTVSLISKTNKVALLIDDSPNGNIQLIDPNGYKDELLTMVDERVAKIAKGDKGDPGEATPEFIAMVKSAEDSADAAKLSETNSKDSEEKTSQAYSDFLNQLGTDVPTLVGGKIPMSQIPATATQEIYTVTSEDELTSLTAQRGDLAELIEEVDGEQTITKTWQCLGDSAIRENWVVWGTSYAVSAGNASTAANAENANMINNHRLVEISAEEFETAVKDENTYYLVY